MIEHGVSAAAVLAFEGELETSDWQRFRDQIIAAAREGTTAVILDLGQVTFFDSSAIRALLGARLVLEPRGVTIYLGACSDIVRRVVEITGIDEVFRSPPMMDGPSPEPGSGGQRGANADQSDGSDGDDI